MLETSWPLLASSQDMKELEFHMSPVRSSSRPHVNVGTQCTSSSSRRARAGSVGTRHGSPTANRRSGITPSGQHRTSYLKNLERPSARAATGPDATDPRSPWGPFHAGPISTAHGTSSTRTMSAAWNSAAGGRCARRAASAS